MRLSRNEKESSGHASVREFVSYIPFPEILSAHHYSKDPKVKESSHKETC